MAELDQNGRRVIAGQGTLVSLGLTKPSKRRKARPPALLEAAQARLARRQGTRPTLKDRAKSALSNGVRQAEGRDQASNVKNARTGPGDAFRRLSGGY